LKARRSHLAKTLKGIEYMTAISSPLAGKVALVTGASRGIGAETARTLASHGATVVVHYGQSRQAADEVVRSIRAAGGTASAMQADLSEAGHALALAPRAAEQAGPLDILVNNAGMIAMGPMHEATAEHIDSQFALNVRAPALVARGFVMHFTGSDGRIINLSTFITDGQAMGGALIYCATKGAINTLTAGWAQELGAKGIRVNAVAPGAVETDMYAASGKAAEDYLKSRTPLGRIGQPRDIASMIAYLCSPQAEWITGQVFSVNGGIRI
jgi:3-oxoacyl-[acyl-carrier protein] reductase